MEHLQQFIDFKGITIHNFEKKLGIRSTIDKAIKQKTNLRSDILTKIVVTFPEINAYWLITGKGEMLVNNSKENYNQVSGPSSTHTKEKSDKEEVSRLIRIIATLEKHTSLQQKIIETQEAFIRNLDKETAPVHEQLQNLNERLEKVEDFKEAIKLLSKVGKEIDKTEKELNEKKSVNRESKSSK